MRAVLYLRLSQSTEESTSIARQEEDLRELAQREGWEVVRVLADDGVSGRKVRANAVEALRMVRDREAEVLAVWKLDRWSRQGIRAVGDLVETLDSVPGALFVAHRDGLRSDAAAWRLIAGVLSETARMEADNTATRIRSSIAHLRQNGRFPGGTVPFGYRTAPRAEGGRTLVPHAPEVAIVREVANRILAGESQASLVSDLTKRNVPTSRSAYRLAEMKGLDPDGLDRGSWSYSGLGAVWTGDSLLGRISRNAGTRTAPRWEVVRAEDGLPLEAFPPLLDAATVAKLREKMRDPKRPTSRTGPRRERRARLLSGLISCDECGQRLWVTVSGGRTVYTCAKRPGRCEGAPNMKVENAERAAVDAYLGVVGHWPEVERIEIVDSTETGAALAEVEVALRETTSELLSDAADSVAIVRRLDALKNRRAQLQENPGEISVEFRPTGLTMREAWLASSDSARRSMLNDAFSTIALRSTAMKGHTGYHPERIILEWRRPDLSLDREALVREYTA